MTKNPILNLFRYTWRYSYGTKKFVVIFISFSVIANIISLLEPIVIGRVFDNVQFAQNDPALFSHLVRSFLLLIAITVGFWAFHGTSRVMEARNAFLVRKNYKQTMFEKVMALPAQWHKDHHSGDTIDKIDKGGENLYSFAGDLFIITENATRLVASIAILSFFDWRATTIAVVGTLIAIGSILQFDNFLRRGYLKIYRSENFIAAGIYDFISNIITIITLRLEKRAAGEIDGRQLQAFPIFNRTRRVEEVKWFLVSLYVTAMTVSILIFNAYHSLKTGGVIVIGTLFILYRYLSSIGNAFYTFAWKWGEVVQQDEAVRAAEVINDDYRRLPAANHSTLDPDWRVLQIKNLVFTYRSSGEIHAKIGHLRDISITIERKRRIALIGESGSGKSTVFSLLRGLHQPDSVKVFSDGRRLPQGLEPIYDQVILIPQEPELFNNTIEYNITMGRKVPGNELKSIIEISRLSSVIERLKKGIRTNVMEKGVSLSGGEKQRLALARGLMALKKHQFLLLDEPTSSVDSTNELLIYRNIFGRYREQTIIAAVHRLHLLPSFDYIYFFKDGQVITEGTFHTLLNDEKFKVIWDSYNLNKK